MFAQPPHLLGGVKSTFADHLRIDRLSAISASRSLRLPARASALRASRDHILQARVHVLSLAPAKPHCRTGSCHSERRSRIDLAPPLLPSITTPICRSRANPLPCRSPRARTRPLPRPHAQTHRHPLDHDHRRGPHRHRPGLRVRLLRRAGLQGAARGRLPRHPGQLQPGHHHDRPGDGRRHLHRADHPRDRGEDHRGRTPRRAPAHHGRPDRPQHRARPRRHGRAGQVQRRAHRRQARRHREGRGPQALPRGHGAHRPREPQGHHRHHRRGGARRHRARRPARHHPPRLHPRRHRRRRRLQPRGLRAHLPGPASTPPPSRQILIDESPPRLEGVRDGGGARQARQLHHRLLHREHRPDGRPHRRLASPSPRR